MAAVPSREGAAAVGPAVEILTNDSRPIATDGRAAARLKRGQILLRPPAWEVLSDHSFGVRRRLQLEQATPDLSPSLYVVLNICRVSAAHRARYRLGVLDESAKHLQQGFAIVQENIPPHNRVARCDASEIAEPGSREPQYLLTAFRGQIVCGTADGEGDQVREM